MLMPSLKPVPIVTKGLSFWKQVWRVLTARRKWRLAEDWAFRLPCGTIVIIPKDFEMDGASTPKVIWGLLDPMGVLLIQGIIHDYGYRYDYLWAIDSEGNYFRYHHRVGRKFWDGLFLDVGNCVNDLQLTGYLSWLMLRLFGNIAWKQNRRLKTPELFPQ